MHLKGSRNIVSIALLKLQRTKNNIKQAITN